MGVDETHTTARRDGEIVFQEMRRAGGDFRIAAGQVDEVRRMDDAWIETGLAPHRLELDITEGVMLNDQSRALAILRRMKALGVRIAMDDFGSGYSSLSYLQSFPFDKIKIDRSFIANLGRNPQSAAIIRAVIGLGRGLQMPIIAEGVETAEQLAFLARESCDEIQGYLVGHPRPIAEYAGIVDRSMVQARQVG